MEGPDDFYEPGDLAEGGEDTRSDNTDPGPVVEPVDAGKNDDETHGGNQPDFDNPSLDAGKCGYGNGKSPKGDRGIGKEAW